MFCSNCGKSLKSDALICPNCGMTVGESRFDSSRGYTGAQTRLKPGQAVRVNSSYVNHYSRDDTVESSENDVLPSDEDSMYRSVKGAGITGYGEDDDREPLFDSRKDDEPAADEAPEDEEQPEAPAEKKPSLFSFLSRNSRESEDDDTDDETRPLAADTPVDEITEEERKSLLHEDVEFAPPAGISEDIHAFMEGRRLALDAEDDIPPIKLKKRSKPAVKDEDFEADFDELPEEKAGEDPFDFEDESKPKKQKKQKKAKAKKTKEKKPAKKEPAPEAITDEPGEDDALYGDDEEYTDEALMNDIKRDKRLKYMRYVLAGLAAVLVILGVVALLGNLRSSMNTAPVEEVSYDLWSEGVAQMEQRVGQSYRRSMMTLYDPSDMSSYVALREQMTRDLEGLNSLMPSNPQRNDRRFIDALRAIQESINNCLVNDALAMSDNTLTAAQKETQSEARWSQVRLMVEALKASTNTGQLDAIIKQEKVELILQATPTPAPGAPTPVPYVSLQKGSKGEDVTKLQTRLSDLGYLSGKIDGEYGNQTKTAVQKFQERAGLKADGIAGLETQTLLFSDEAPYAK
ncbi:MAG: peptidoglycan-binding protein [Clostridia bacterium]|nr:peptidoglycan-binding protein [Clostridia bacterium]